MEKQDIRFFDGAELRFWSEDDKIIVEVRGEGKYVVGELIKCFPLTDARRYISIRDEEGKEIGILRELDALERDSRRLVEAELEKRYFMPLIKRVYSLREGAGVIELDVLTDRGRRRIELPGRGEAINEVEPGRIILTDISGGLYEIRDYASLDLRSARLLNQIL